MRRQKCLNENCRIAKSELKGNLSKALKQKKVSKKEAKNDSLPKKVKRKRPKENAIFALNHDCLIEVFRYLSMNDLINLVNASQKFLPSAVKAYGLQYRHEVLSIYVQPDTTFIMRLDCQSFYGTYTLQEMKLFFRNFGAAVNVIEIEHGPFEQQLIYSLLKSISKYCCKSVTDLRLEKFKVTPRIMKCLQPLQQILKQLTLYECDLNRLQNLFVEFPNLAVLRLYHVSLHPEILQRVFPNLQKFSIYRSRYLMNEHLIRFIRRNRQLTEFDVRYCPNITQRIFERIGTHLTNLTELHIHFDKDQYTGTFDQYPLNVRNLQRTSLVGFKHLDTYLNQMAESNQTLNAVEIHDQKDDKQIAKLIDCIGHYKNIDTLEFHETHINDEHLAQMAKKMPKLKELNLNSNSCEMNFSFDALIRLADACKQLTLLKLNTRRAKTLQLKCETLHGFVDVIESRQMGSAKKICICSRDSIHVKVPRGHLDTYQQMLKLELRT